MARKKSAAKDIKGKLDFDRVAHDIVNTPVDEFTNETYFLYAASVILDRSLIGEDGLLPVQKRIIWAMYVNHILPTSSYAKVLSIIGDVSKYHPHGDSSIGNSIVRMAQPYSLRTCLVDGSGNFATIPGDDAAAPRYIDARMTKAALDCVEEVKYDAVEMGKNYSGKLDEPKQLPVRIPLSIINGANGIAVGFSTNMPQHNPTEVMKVARLLLKNPKASLQKIMSIMPGPDFITGGKVMGTSGIKEYYSTGRGKMVIRSKYRIEQGAGGKTTIVFYEVPPMVTIDQCQSALNEIFDSEQYKDSKDKKKAKKYHSLASARKVLNGISRAVDLTDFETGNGVDYEIELKASANPTEVILALFKNTPLESPFSVNNTVIYEGLPKVVNIRELFMQFIDFRRKCVLNVSKKKKELANQRIKMIDGILSVLLDMDKTVKIIRSSDDDKIAQQNLMKAFKIDEEQSDYILSMQLRRLTRQNSVALQEEKKGLVNDINEYDGIINDPAKRDAEVDRLLQQSAKIVATDRSMEILDATDEEIAQMDKNMKSSVKLESKDSPCVITVLPEGDKIVRTLGRESKNRHYKGILFGTNQHKVISVGTDGIGYGMTPSYILQDKEVSIKTAFIIPDKVDNTGLVNDGSPMLTVSSDGFIKITNQQFNEKWSSHPIQGLKSAKSRIVAAIQLPEYGSKQYERTEVILVSKSGKSIRFNIDELKPTGYGATGVVGMKLKDDEIADAVITSSPNEDSLTTITNATAKSTPIKQIPLQKRAGAGVILQRVVKGDSIKETSVNGKILQGRSVSEPKSSKRDGMAMPTPPKSKLISA
jgi:DNA gyrase subunit A